MITRNQETMPRLTRDQQFQASFKRFMDEICSVYYPDLREWDLNCETANKTSSVHEYAFNIPQKVVVYSVDAYIDPEGVLHPPETVEGEQEVPAVPDFLTHFHNYFDAYILKHFDTMLSYTSMIQINSENGFNGKIVVSYYKSHLPYPSEKKTFEQLQERCNHLERENKYLGETIADYSEVSSTQAKELRKLRRRLNRIQLDSVLKLRETVHKMQSKIRGYYEELGKTDECPVCYECIKSHQLMVPGCCHYICSDCHDRCDICPICREEY